MKKLPIIRHVRALWKAYWFFRWWEREGSRMWLSPNTGDEQYLRDVWEGRA